MTKSFYESDKWIELRKIILEVYPKKCMKCGYEKRLQVDHISPISLNPRLKLYPNNLQILCRKCNMKKSNISYRDYRTKSDLFELEKRLFKDDNLKKYRYLSIPQLDEKTKKEIEIKSKKAKKRRLDIIKKST